jgi:anti-sigma-K factor RskA
MTTPRQPKDDRLEELLIRRALGGLSAAEANEVVVRGGAYDQSYDVAAAALDLATLRVEAMPASLEARLLAQAETGTLSPASGRDARPASVRSLSPRQWGRWTGWLAAAAVVALAAYGWRTGRLVVSSSPSSVAAKTPPDPTEERAALVASAKDAKVLPWSTTKDAAAEHASGDVIWSQSAQAGFMRFRGLAANDKNKTQYQLWIFDKTQDYPVDGGVFDAPANGEVVVPIVSKLHVGVPTLFAVTVEKPGGVVVSKRERIVVTAAVEG